MESFGRYVAVVLVVGVAFILLITGQTKKSDKFFRMYIREKGEAFIEKIEYEKVISITEWESFCKEVNRFGCVCAPEIKVGEVKKNGDSGVYYQMTYDNEIKEELQKSGSYLLKKGVFVMVKVYEKKGGVKRVYFERARKIR